MLSSNQKQVKKLVILGREEIQKIEKEEKKRLQELKERKSEEKKRKKEEKLKKKSKRKSNTSKSSKSTSSPKELEKPSSSDFAIIIDDVDDEDEKSAFSSPISISSDDCSPPMAGSSVFEEPSPILMNETESIPSSPIRSLIRSPSTSPIKPLLTESPQNSKYIFLYIIRKNPEIFKIKNKKKYIYIYIYMNN